MLDTISDTPAGYTDECLEEGLFLCKADHSTKQLHSELGGGLCLKQYREALEAQVLPRKNRSGSLIIVHPAKYHMPTNAIKH